MTKRIACRQLASVPNHSISAVIDIGYRWCSETVVPDRQPPLRKAHHLYAQLPLDNRLARLQPPIYVVDRTVVPLASFPADLGFHVGDDAKPALEPRNLAYSSLDYLTAAELADHFATDNAYTVMMIRSRV